MRRAQSKKHKTGTYEIKKTSLSCFDDKSDILDDGVHTLAYFHKNLKSYIFTKRKGFKKNSQKKEEIFTDNHI